MSAPVALAEQLAAVARGLAAVRQGRSLADVLPAVPERLRPGVQALLFLALRRWGEARAVRALLARRAPAPAVAGLVEVALALLIEGGHYPPYAVVDQAVAALVHLRAPALSGFVNACLRRFLREREALLARAHASPEGCWNHPAWWIERLQRDHPRHWAAVLQANDQPGPMVLRVNRRQTTRDAYRAQLLAQGWAADPIGDDGLVLALAVPVERLPGWQAGQVSVQDGAAQWAAPLLIGSGLRPGARVLDACAAPGGKSAHLLERADIELWALDADRSRLARVRDTLQRLGLLDPARVHLRHADAAQPSTWWDGRPFDAILLDAPCSASGIVRRHPDVRWLRRDADIARLATTQRQLLMALWPLLAPGGRLLYATCSVFRAEGSEVVADFLAQHPDARPLPAPGQLLPGGVPADDTETTTALLATYALGDNARRGMDGFFFALLTKG
jgi:16S rRNA (cytosine967-C5)-methyltransferase